MIFNDSKEEINFSIKYLLDSLMEKSNLKSRQNEKIEPIEEEIEFKESA